LNLIGFFLPKYACDNSDLDEDCLIGLRIKVDTKIYMAMEVQ